ncbi:MAG: SDR family oxidoreductase [Anaerolineales bacterium]
MTRLLVTGAAGYLGRRIIHYTGGQEFVGRTAHLPPGGWQVVGAYHRAAPPDAPVNCAYIQVDLRDAAQASLRFAQAQPDIVIHTAGSNQSPEQVAAIEPMSHTLTLLCAESGARLIHVSTDMVFGGDAAPYADEAAPAPLHPYGEAKARAEDIVRSRCPAAAIVRPSLIFGLQPLDHQTRWLLDGIEAGTPVRLFTDEYRCPIWVDNLAVALLELATLDYTGPLNLTGPQRLNRWEFGMKLLSALRLEPGDMVRPATIAESGLTRPADLTLDVSRAQALLRTPLLSVDEALAVFGRPTTNR